MAMTKLLCFRIIAGILGVLLAVAGLFLLTIFPEIVGSQVKERTFLGENENNTLNDMTYRWAYPAYKITLQVWMFNVENPQEVLKGSKMNVTQKGPYTFRESIEKFDLNFADNQTKLYYRSNKAYFFDANQSCADCSLGDKVTIPNILLQSIISFVYDKDLKTLEAKLMAFFLKKIHEYVFNQMTVGEALFDGFPDPLLHMCDYKLIKPICKKFNVTDRIGFFYQKNNTNDGLYLIHTGQKNRDDIGRIISWKGEAILPEGIWSTNISRMINGSDGSLFHANIKKSDKLYVFVGDLCRSAYVHFSHSSSESGIPAHRFTIPSEVLDIKRLENRGFCNPLPYRFFSNETQPDGCLPSGMLDISKCLPGNPPVYLTMSHFLFTPKEVQESVDGMARPSMSDDTTYMDIEPTSGAVVGAKRRMQMNVGMFNGNGTFPTVARMHNVVAPILFLNESAIIDNGTRSYLRSSLINLQQDVYIFGIILLVFGIILIVGTILSFLCVKFKSFGPESTDFEPLNEGYGEIEGDENSSEQPILRT